jgi:hypothetical protein
VTSGRCATRRLRPWRGEGHGDTFALLDPQRERSVVCAIPPGARAAPLECESATCSEERLANAKAIFLITSAVYMSASHAAVSTRELQKFG